MLKRVHPHLAAAALAAVLAGCAAPQPDVVEIRRGVVEQIVDTQIASNQPQGVGAVLGGLAGVGIGSLIGAGTGRDVAMATWAFSAPPS